MKKTILPLIILAGITLSACNGSKSTDATPTISKEDAVAVVNGQYISKASLSTLEQEVAERSKGKAFPKEKFIEELIQRELLVQDAVQKKLDKSDDFIDRLSMIKSSLLSQAAIHNYIKSNPVTDAELESEYNKNMGKAGTEYKARHILVKTEDEAKLIIEELNKGADFIELAKTKSTGPSSPKGGDLGWFTSERMVQPFSQAVIAIEDTKFTTEPVKTQFGWHIILREESRTQTPPPLETVKEQIRPIVQRQKLQDFMVGLRKQAKVEILLPDTKAEEKASTDSSIAKKVSNAVSKTAEKTVDRVKNNTKDALDLAGESAKKAKDAVVSNANKVADKISQTTTSTLDAVKK